MKKVLPLPKTMTMRLKIFTDKSRHAVDLEPEAQFAVAISKRLEPDV